ncbi:hypothetical protein NBRC111894_1434 [Sporolactobacillus inulinus]|uniref:Uncharacterized protein n=1 Tax=Sporolactobacillus inulinus TaxID=2078 RepID=A0A4Y1ZA30_9BACL|nr:hypothetical protein NBRC111894_1434 [Sporolactobacillus inulinus]
MRVKPNKHSECVLKSFFFEKLFLHPFYILSASGFRSEMRIRIFIGNDRNMSNHGAK